MKQAKLSLMGSAILLALASSANAASLKDTDVEFGGYIKADIMFSDYGNGAPDSGISLGSFMFLALFMEKRVMAIKSWIFKLAKRVLISKRRLMLMVINFLALLNSIL